MSAGDTSLQGIAVDTFGNIAIGALTSDSALAPTANANIAAYRTNGAATWDWIKQLGSITNTQLVDIKLRAAGVGSMVLLFDTTLLLSISTTTS